MSLIFGAGQAVNGLLALLSEQEKGIVWQSEKAQPSICSSAFNCVLPVMVMKSRWRWRAIRLTNRTWQRCVNIKFTGFI